MAFMQVALGAVGVGVVLVLAYVMIAQARSAMPTSTAANNLTNITNAMNSAQSTIFAGFGLLAVGIIVIAAFGMINLWK